MSIPNPQRLMPINRPLLYDEVNSMIIHPPPPGFQDITCTSLTVDQLTSTPGQVLLNINDFAGNPVFSVDAEGDMGANSLSCDQDVTAGDVVLPGYASVKSTLDTYATSISTAQTTATSAQSTASSAQSTASSAATAAATAQTTANSAQTTANSVQTALTTTNSNVSTLQSQMTTANNNIATNTSSITSLQSSKQDKFAGTTAQYVRGDGTLATYTATGGMASLSPLTGNNVIYLSPVGSDSNNGASEENPVASLSQALTLAGNSGRQVCVFPGTYSGDTNITALNVTITAMNSESGGIVNFTGTWTFNHTSSSVRVYGVSVANLVHSNSGSLYLERVRCNSSLSLVGSGYFQATQCDFQGASLTGVVSVTATAGTKNLIECFVGATSINGSGVAVSISNCISCFPIVLQAGVLGINNTPIYAAASNTNAVTATGASSVLVAYLSKFLTPSQTPARISVSSSATYSLVACTYDSTNSTLTGTLSAVPLRSDAISTGTLTALSLSTTGNVSIGGNLTVSGTTTTINTTTTVANNMILNFTSANTTPALAITQTGGSGNILSITDADSSEIFAVTQGADLNINGGKFTVDAATGNVAAAGTLAVSGVSTLSERLGLPSFTTTQMNALTSPANGQLVYNSTAGQVYAYLGGSWQAVGAGSGFSPVITSVAQGDLLYYDGTNWVNGIYVDPPTVTANFKTLTASALSSPFNLTAQYVQYQIYASDGTTLITDSGNLAAGSSYTYSSLTNGTTYKGRARNKATRTNAVSPWCSLVTFTPSLILPTAVYSVRTSTSNTPSSVSADQTCGNGSAAWSSALTGQSLSQSQRVQVIQGTAAAQWGLATGGSAIDTQCILLDYGASTTFPSGNIVQFTSLSSTTEGGWGAFYANYQDVAYWNGSGWTNFINTNTSFSGSAAQTVTFSSSGFTTRYIRILPLGNPAGANYNGNCAGLRFN